LHLAKHDLQRISTDDGMIIDFNPEYANADSSIRINFESFSNNIDSSDLHESKQDLPTISTDDGMIINFNPDSQNPNSSIRINFESLSKINDSSKRK
jgi:hypothetical protein